MLGGLPLEYLLGWVGKKLGVNRKVGGWVFWGVVKQAKIEFLTLVVCL